MLVLAIDTSQKNGSVGLARGDESSFELIGSALVDGGMFSAQLVPVIAKLLDLHNLNKRDLQGISAAIGPGSFTGLRIGLAAVKALADVLQIPVAGISVLEAMAVSAEESDQAKHIFVAMDAGRSEVYAGEYAFNDGELCKIREWLCTRNEFIGSLGLHNKNQVVVATDPNLIAEAKTKKILAKEIGFPGCEVIARLGLKKLGSGKAIHFDNLDANYLRRDESLFFRGQTGDLEVKRKI